MQRLEQVLEGTAPAKPTPFDVFCQKKLNEFRACVKKEISRSAPVKAKLQKLVELIISLHAPDCRGNIMKLYFTSH
jgi:hypothetical protein